MKVLFLGNSFTYFSDLPAMVQWMADKAGIDLQTDSVTRGGAYLHQFADPADEMYERWLRIYKKETWDAVVCQDQSFHPVKSPAELHQAALDVQSLCRPGQKMVMYQTWAYKDGSDMLADTGFTYHEMLTRMTASYADAAAAVGGDVTPVGQTFAQVYALHPEIELYNPDGYHPSPAGTYLAACLFLAVLTGHSPLYFPIPDIVSVEEGGILRSIADWQMAKVCVPLS
ncbi:MAG: hypothetical protein E7631_11855 [Ruminococcaceae bacterium]|nr:hypothetical protein [Oscillospiraceae bacterium]